MTQNRPISDDYRYSEDDIVVLKFNEAIRARPGMYIGGPDTRGLHLMLESIITEGLGEYLHGSTTAIRIVLGKDGRFSYGRNGQGIDPFQNDEHYAMSVFQSMHAANSWWWSSEEDRKIHRCTIHGVSGFPAANALSEYFIAETIHDGYRWQLRFERGELTVPLQRLEATSREGFSIIFRPDREIFGDANFCAEGVRELLRDLAALVPGIRLELIEEATGREDEFYFPQRVRAIVEAMNETKDVLFPEILHRGSHVPTVEGALELHLALQPTNGFESQIRYFVNAFPCEFGTHRDAFQKGFACALNQYGENHQLFHGAVPKLEHYLEGLTGVVALWTTDPQYRGHDRMEILEPLIEDAISEITQCLWKLWAEEHPELATQWIEKAIAAAEMDSYGE